VLQNKFIHTELPTFGDFE